MKKSVSIMLVCTFIFSSCASYNPEKFLRKKEVIKFSYPITPVALWKKYEVNNLSRDIKKVIVTSHNFAFNDLSNIQAHKNRYGFAVYNLEWVDHSVGWGWLFPLAGTIGISGLLGIPVGSQTAKTKINMDILDANLNKIDSYEAEGEETAYAALYWGYDGVGAVSAPTFGITCTDVSLTESFMAAFDKLNNKIVENSEDINRKLAAAGPNTIIGYEKLAKLYPRNNIFTEEEEVIFELVRKENTREAYNSFSNLFPHSKLNK